MKTIALLTLLALAGCEAIAPRIVTTEVTKTADGGWTIKSPKDVKATYMQAGPMIYISYQSTGNSEAIQAGTAEAASRAAAIGKLAEAAASLK